MDVSLGFVLISGRTYIFVLRAGSQPTPFDDLTLTLTLILTLTLTLTLRLSLSLVRID